MGLEASSASNLGGLRLIAFAPIGGSVSDWSPSVPPHFRDLEIRWQMVGRDGPTDVFLRFNGDTGLNYDWSRSGQSGTTSSISSQITQTSINVGRAGGGSPQGGSGVIYIPGYNRDTGNWKNVNAISSSYDGNATGQNFNLLHQGRWRSVAPITSLQFYVNTILGPGCHIALYGAG